MINFDCNEVFKPSIFFCAINLYKNHKLYKNHIISNSNFVDMKHSIFYNNCESYL